MVNVTWIGYFLVSVLSDVPRYPNGIQIVLQLNNPHLRSAKLNGLSTKEVGWLPFKSQPKPKQPQVLAIHSLLHLGMDLGLLFLFHPGLDSGSILPPSSSGLARPDLPELH